MFENPIIFSIFMGLIVSIGYIIYYKNKENKEKKKNSIILFSVVFILSLIINICFNSNNDKPVKGGYTLPKSDINNNSPTSNRDIPPF